VTILHQDALLDAIKALPLKDRLVITPLLDEAQVGPSSIDLRLGTDFIELHRLERETLDPFSKTLEALVREERLVVPLGDDLILHPGQFILGATLEFLRMPDHLAGEVLNRSSWARMGLIVATAVFVQPGYSGVLTLELVNMGSVPMRLRPGLRIAQLVVSQLAGRPMHPYGVGEAKYVAPLGPERSKLDRESGEWRRLSRIGEALRGQSGHEGDKDQK
jgi:dCTP deaminase